MSNSTEKKFHTVRGYQLKKQNKSRLTPALEDYLEMAYRLCIKESYTRINKLSECLNVRPSSTSKMVSRLVELGYLKYDNHTGILLTDKGKKTGEYLLERHNILEYFFTFIGSSNPLEETELVEHMLCPSTVYKIQSLLDFFASNPDVSKKFKSFRNKKT